MNTPRKRQPSRQPKLSTASREMSHQFEDMPDPRDVVEHLTIPGFMRRAPHKFHIDELTRFGDKVGRVAESLQVSYLTTIDSSLGVIRLFPVPLLIRVYNVMAQQFRWNPWSEPLVIEDRGPAELLRSNERTKKHLQAVSESAEMPPEVGVAMATVMQWLESEAKRLGEVDPATPPLRVV